MFRPILARGKTDRKVAQLANIMVLVLTIGALILAIYTSAGMGTGIAIAVFLMLTGRDPYKGVNAGFIAPCCNFVVTGVVSLLTTARASGFDDILPPVAASSCRNGASSA